MVATPFTTCGARRRCCTTWHDQHCRALPCETNTFPVPQENENVEHRGRRIATDEAGYKKRGVLQTGGRKERERRIWSYPQSVKGGSGGVFGVEWRWTV